VEGKPLIFVFDLMESTTYLQVWQALLADCRVELTYPRWDEGFITINMSFNSYSNDHVGERKL